MKFFEYILAGALGAMVLLGVLIRTNQINHDPWSPPQLDERFLSAINEQLDNQSEGTLGLDVCDTCEGRGDKACGQCSGAGWAIHGIAPAGARPQPSWCPKSSPFDGPYEETIIPIAPPEPAPEPMAASAPSAETASAWKYMLPWETCEHCKGNDPICFYCYGGGETRKVRDTENEPWKTQYKPGAWEAYDKAKMAEYDRIWPKATTSK